MIEIAPLCKKCVHLLRTSEKFVERVYGSWKAARLSLSARPYQSNTLERFKLDIDNGFIKKVLANSTE